MPRLNRFPPRLSFPRPLPVLACTLLLATPAGAAFAESGTATAQEVEDRAIAFHGGELYESTETAFTLASRSGGFRGISRVDGDRFDHTVVGTGRDGAERQIRVTNESVELWLDGVPQKVATEAEQRLRDVVNARVYFPFLPYRLNDPGVHKRDLGFEEWDGRRVRTIEVSFEAGGPHRAEDG